MHIFTYELNYFHNCIILGDYNALIISYIFPGRIGEVCT